MSEDYFARARESRRRASLSRRPSRFMYCVRVTLTFMGDEKPSTVYLRFRTDVLNNMFTDNPRDAKLWLYRPHADQWAFQHRDRLTGSAWHSIEVIKLERDNEVLKCQEGRR